MPRCGIYSLARDFTPFPGEDTVFVMDPYWIIAVLRLGQPLSFNRKTLKSDSNDLTAGALLRAQMPLLISDDCHHINISNHKSTHIKSLNFSLKATDVNYMVEILPDDWVLAWMVNNRTDYERLRNNIEKIAIDPKSPELVNDFNDGLKFVGRIDEVFKDTQVDGNTGTKMAGYNVRATGFKELDTQLYYDPALATSDAQNGNFGWMARFGVSIDALFGQNAEQGIEENNINKIIPKLMDLVVGHGPNVQANIPVEGEGGRVTATPQLDARDNNTDAGDPPFSYLVPSAVGNLLKKSEASKGILSYCDIVELWTGVQSYSRKSGKGMFTPDFEQSDQLNRRICSGGKLLGTFLPFTLDFANRPLWSVFQQYVNHTINELFTALKVNERGLIVPTIVFRQIPFTTDALMLPTDSKETGVEGPIDINASQEFVTADKSSVRVTKFLDLPRWNIPAAMVRRSHVGRSNATRTNFVHIYGSTTYLENGGIPVQYQMLTNPPIRDDVDIFRSGMRGYMTTVDCWVDDTVGKAPGKWMALVADWMMGSHLTFSGTIDCYGIQAPIAEGDNVSFDGVVYHVMSVDHNASLDPHTGSKSWFTTLNVTNGMRDISKTISPAYNEKDLTKGLQPLYPGLSKLDNTALDPGLTLEGPRTTGGDASVERNSKNWDDPNTATQREGTSQLNPSDNNETADNTSSSTAAAYRSPSGDRGQR